ncbi:putative leucine-rich repeat domain superfamily [Helianthus annuus]|uniref:Leucine-rich repeat domain superfamily n=1 Tax=Helianthus annuus TaxID=4232 RepID=A0A251UNB5_HELAN|nr:putative leucine-rich repeat domain superfamily [Helianthus annuus]KAJ0605216.1 putative leucine-rich repeat domain superfamily [Helianthus annuus]KAJ0619231.1 putative leucine-rich repeat domain superfamily [Helianthus annuus]KAJ0777683.1 putative leucine-rich repeat domain superfamily [Helianthus annuus]KAJ0786704.1 putative leucine-rich repeat domain superfamily [Helianthus annuus]
METLAKNCNNLNRFSCGSFAFGSKGINTVINNCSLLEELSVKRLRGIGKGGCFGSLITGSKDLRTLKFFRCSGDWDKLLELVSDHVDGLVEVHLERLQMSDAELVAVTLKLHIDGWKTNRINDEWLIGVSNLELLAINCQKLERLALCGSETLCIKSCPVSYLGMEAFAGGCPNLVKVKVNKCRGVTSDGVGWLGILNTENILLLFNGGEVMR